MSTEQDLLPTIINQASSFDTVETGWYEYQGTVAWDTSEKKVGSQSVRLTTTAWTGSYWLARTAKDYSPAISIAGKNFGFWLKAPSTALYVSVIFLNDYGWSNYAFEYINLTWCRPQGNTWRFFPFCSGTLNTVGSFNPNNVIQILVTVGSSSNTAQFWFDGIYEQANEFPNGAVIIRIDDGNVEDFTNVKPVLDTYGYKACSFLVKKDVGADSSKMTFQQVRQLHQEGWDICNHSTHHLALDSLTEAQVTEEVLTCKRFLQEMGIKNGYRFFASPYASHSPTSEAVINQYNIVSVGVGGTIPNVGDIVPYPLFNPYLIDATDCTYTTTVQQLQQWASAVKSAKALGVVLFHRIVSGTPNEYEYNVNDFASFIQYLNQQGIPVLTFTDLLRRYYIDVQVNFQLQSYTIPALNQVNFSLQQIGGVPTDNLLSIATSTSTATAFQIFVNQVLSTIVSLSSQVDRQQYIANLLSTINSVSSRTDNQVYVEVRLSTATSTVTVLDFKQFFETLLTTISSLSQSTTAQIYKDAPQTTVLEISTIADIQTYLAQLSSVISSISTERDLQIYFNTLQTIANSVSSVQEFQIYLELIQSLLISQVSIIDIKQYIENLITVFSALDSIVDVIQFYELIATISSSLIQVIDKQNYIHLLQTVASASSSISEIQNYLDTALSTFIALTNIQDRQQFIELITTVCNSIVSVKELAIYTELIYTLVVSQINLADIQTFIERISTLVTSSSTILDSIAEVGAENVETVIASIGVILDRQYFLESLLSTITSISNSTDKISYFELLSTIINSSTSTQDFKVFVDSLVTVITSVSSIQEIVDYVEHLLTLIQSISTEEDIYQEAIGYIEILSALATSFSNIKDLQEFIEILYSSILTVSEISDVAIYVDTPYSSIVSISNIIDTYYPFVPPLKGLFADVTYYQTMLVIDGDIIDVLFNKYILEKEDDVPIITWTVTEATNIKWTKLNYPYLEITLEGV